jgi:hypothetical protein
MKLRKRISKKAATERHLEMPFDEWRLKKRGEWQHVLRAISVFEFGAAYTPAGVDLHILRQCAERIGDAMREDWVSW